MPWLIDILVLRFLYNAHQIQELLKNSIFLDIILIVLHLIIFQDFFSDQKKKLVRINQDNLDRSVQESLTFWRDLGLIKKIDIEDSPIKLCCYLDHWDKFHINI